MPRRRRRTGAGRCADSAPAPGAGAARCPTAAPPCPTAPPLAGRWHRWLARWLWLPLLGLAALVASPARAGNLPGELPALVGRLNMVAGEVQLQDRDSGRWDASPGGGQGADAGLLRNWPVAEGDRLRLGRDARAELRIGSTTLRLGAGAQLWLQQMDGQAVVLQLQDGTLALRLAAVDGDAFGPVEVRTREGRWLPRRPGHYRFDRETDATQASVWRGELQFEGFDSALTITENRRADLWLDRPDGTRRAATRFAWANVERDGFADWVARDERQDDAPRTARYVPPGITGWQDLDRHGDWIADSDQGPLWLPTAVPAGWAPYQTGRWAWVSPWGWTWIDAAPWGFAPFHYGSWLRFDGRWAWSPGRPDSRWHGHRDPRVHFAPALKGWVGGPGLGITVQIGGQRPPPPRVVVPVVPVVVVRPGHARPLPPVVVAPARPDRRWDARSDDDAAMTGVMNAAMTGVANAGTTTATVAAGTTGAMPTGRTHRAWWRLRRCHRRLSGWRSPSARCGWTAPSVWTGRIVRTVCTGLMCRDARCCQSALNARSARSAMTGPNGPNGPTAPTARTARTARPPGHRPDRPDRPDADNRREAGRVGGPGRGLDREQAR